MEKTKLSLIGLLQALGVIVYCVLVGGFLWSAGEIFVGPQSFWNVVLMLALLVFSAAVTGSLVFGYAAYLALHKKSKEALQLLAYTLLYCLGLIIIIFTVIFAVK